MVDLVRLSTIEHLEMYAGGARTGTLACPFVAPWSWHPITLLQQWYGCFVLMVFNPLKNDPNGAAPARIEITTSWDGEFKVLRPADVARPFFHYVRIR